MKVDMKKLGIVLVDILGGITTPGAGAFPYRPLERILDIQYNRLAPSDSEVENTATLHGYDEKDLRIEQMPAEVHPQNISTCNDISPNE